MWYRLKSSLLTATVATVLVLGFLTVAEPAADTAPPASPLHGLTGLDVDQERAAYQLAIALAALTIDAAVEARGESPRKSEAARGEAKPRQAVSAARMPFYSFAAKAARRAESGA